MWYKKASTIMLTSGMKCRKSPIHGLGIFAPRDFSSGERVFKLVHPCKKGSCRSEACRLTNHSNTPNLRLERHGDEIWTIADSDIREGSECTVNYKSVLPLLMNERPISAGPVHHETPGIEEIIKDPPGLTLLDNLKDIETGKYI